MPFIKFLAVMTTALTLAACGTPPKFQERRPAAAPAGQLSLGSSPLVQQTNHMTQHLNAEKTIVYSQPFGGGGVALGLLGPFGVAANISMIESATKADTDKLFGKVRIDPVQSFRLLAEIKRIGLAASPGSTSQKLTPYLLVSKTKETTLSAAVALLLDTGGVAPAKYVLQLPETYSVEQLAAIDQAGTDALQRSVDRGFDQLLDFFVKDVGESSAAEPKVLVKSAFMSPRFEFELQGSVADRSNEITWIRTYGGVYGLQNSTFSSSPVK
ncbi:MAG: hypothetical protein RL375_132 [Pseudomonadota bacterium]|jgi:hypothetical protein